MSLRDKLGSTLKQATDYLETVNLKDKVIEMKDKTIDRVKGIDNPDHYTAPAGFELFKIPVAISSPEITKTLDKIEPFHLREKDKIIDAYVRLLALLSEDEKIIDAITATMKKTYLIVWTNKDKLLIVHKEHYKVLTREEMSVFKVTGTSTFGLNFSLNQYQFTGNEKSKVYRFIRSYCHENTEKYVFTPYISISKTLNYYERFKYGKLTKENEAINENKELSILFEPTEFPLVSIYATFLDKKYVIALSTNRKIYMIDQNEYTIIPINKIGRIELMNKGMFSYEFYMDNYYFTGSGPEVSVIKFIEYITNPDSYENARNEFLKANQVLVTFPFEGATSYQTPGGEAFILSKSGNTFLVSHGMNGMEMYSKNDFDHYELLMELGISKDDMWSGDKASLEGKKTITKEEAIQNYDKVRIRIFAKNKMDYIVELPFILLKKVVYHEIEEKTEASMAVTKEFLDKLDYLKQ